MSDNNDYADSIVNRLTINADISELVEPKDAVTVEYVNQKNEDKIDKEGGVFTGVVQFNDYIRFGKRWRLKESSDGRRLVFEYCEKADNVSYKIAIPFIQSK